MNNNPLIIVVFLACITNPLWSQCPVFMNKLDFSIDQENNSFTISGWDDCHPCSYGVEGSIACECRKDCQDSYTDCAMECMNTVTINQLTSCIYECRDLRTSCYIENGCEEEVKPIREITSIQYSWDLWVSTDPLATRTGNRTSAGIFVNTATFSNGFGGFPQSKLTLFSTANPIPLEPISYCYDTVVTIQYDDGSCCIFMDSDCVNRD